MRRYGYICICFERNSQVKKEFFRVIATKNKKGEGRTAFALQRRTRLFNPEFHPVAAARYIRPGKIDFMGRDRDYGRIWRLEAKFKKVACY